MLFIAALFLQLNAAYSQTKIIHESQGFIVIGDDAVLYKDINNKLYTTDPTHVYFDNMMIDMPLEDHISKLKELIFGIDELNMKIKNEYLSNDVYINTEDQGAKDTLKLIKKQYASRELIRQQYVNTISNIKSSI